MNEIGAFTKSGKPLNLKIPGYKNQPIAIEIAGYPYAPIKTSKPPTTIMPLEKSSQAPLQTAPTSTNMFSITPFAILIPMDSLPFCWFFLSTHHCVYGIYLIDHYGIYCIFDIGPAGTIVAYEGVDTWINQTKTPKTVPQILSQIAKRRSETRIHSTGLLTKMWSLSILKASAIPVKEGNWLRGSKDGVWIQEIQFWCKLSLKKFLLF